MYQGANLLTNRDWLYFMNQECQISKGKNESLREFIISVSFYDNQPPVEKPQSMQVWVCGIHPEFLCY